MEILFLSLDEVLEIHQQQIERYGGSLGIRDVAGLESAVATPEATFGGEYLHTSIPAMAAAYLFHLCQNHAFIDGNKRAGANAAITFLLNERLGADVRRRGICCIGPLHRLRKDGKAEVDRDFRIALHAG
jgi:death-on-curing family protein